MQRLHAVIHGRRVLGLRQRGHRSTLPPRNGTAGTEQQPERDEANEQPVPERLVITPPTIELDEPGQTDSDPHVDVVKPAAGLDGRGAAGQLVRPSSCGHVVASNRSSTWGS